LAGLEKLEDARTSVDEIQRTCAEQKIELA